ncbi:MAG: hypothetical protein AAGA42_14335 [Actinomycetota bacterium]
MSGERARLVVQLDRDVELIVSGLPGAFRQVGEWMGGHSSKVPGARPPMSSGSPVVRDEEDAGESSTLVESAVFGSGLMFDGGSSELLGQLAFCARLARRAVASIDDVAAPFEPQVDREYLAVLRWAVKRLHLERDRADIAQLRRLTAAVGRTVQMVDGYQPKERPAIEGCRLHAELGDYEPVSKNFTASGLCSRCGRFKQQHQAEPTREILRCWGRSITPTAQMVARAESIGKKKRKQKRRRGRK